jgi:hypothetical protein
VSSGRDSSSFIVTVSTDLRTRALERLEGLGIDRAVAFIRPPFAENARRLAAGRR